MQMTFDQLVIFVAVAERQHLTRAAAHLHLTPSAVSASIKALEQSYDVRLFERVGRGIELTQAGKLFLGEARAILARADEARAALGDLGALRRGSLSIRASQTIANYWLPRRLLAYHQKFPDIELQVDLGNTQTVAEAIVDGSIEIGFIEGFVDAPAIASVVVATDRMVVAVDPQHPLAGSAAVDLEDIAAGTRWIMREPGSGTRSEFEAALSAHSVDPASLDIALTLPSNEAVLSALAGSDCAAVLSLAVVEPFQRAGRIAVLDARLPARQFHLIHHRERHLSAAARELQRLCTEA
jgi:DNA-binding transcriptional LysR family regulator